MNNIRNFCILAHVDHGKSTLADRFLETTGTVLLSSIVPQFLDSNPISRERGITIKLAPVRMNCKGYIFNLIDTPGHVDFSYEVSRSLAACEGALLIVDATQGIQAQTLAYFDKAKNQGLKILPVVNKIDLPASQPEETALSLINSFGFAPDDILFVSAKTGEGMEELIAAIIKKIPPPSGQDKLTRALVFDSLYDPHKGVIIYVRIIDGKIEKNSGLKLMATNTDFYPVDIGYFVPEPKSVECLETGAVGFIATGLKDIRLARVGDTVVFSSQMGETAPLVGYQQPKPMVFVGLYPTDQAAFNDLADALGKLRLNDASFGYQPESSLALGKGFRVGFLGPLHAEVITQRLEREFNLELISTAANVEYQAIIRGSKVDIQNVSQVPEDCREIFEPVMQGTILTPAEYLGPILELAKKKRGSLLEMEYLDRQVKLVYELPLAEIISNFFPLLKSASSGFASFNYELIGFRKFDGVKLDILIGGIQVDALSKIVSRNQAYLQGRELVERLSGQIPKQMFEFAIQASIRGKIISRITKKSWRKDVTAKLYGGDQSRKDKLLDKQKKGKKRMKAVGKVYIPQEAFLAVLKNS